MSLKTVKGFNKKKSAGGDGLAQEQLIMVNCGVLFGGTLALVVLGWPWPHLSGGAPGFGSSCQGTGLLLV